MRKKQVLALLLSGALTMSMAPAAVYAADDISTFALEDVQDADTQEAEYEAAAEENSSEEPGITDDSAVTSPTETPAEEPAETPAEQPTDTPVETPEEPAETSAESTAEETPEAVEAADSNIQPAAEETPEATAAAGPFMIGVTAYDTLEDAIEAVQTGPEDDEATVIYITENQEIASTVSIPSDKSVILAAESGENITISRAAGFTGNMFEVDGMLQFGQEVLDEAGNDTSGTLTVDGAGDGTVSSGSIVSISDDGVFALNSGVTLKNNNTSADGSAIYCTSGIILLSGGSITGNITSGNGGAIYTGSEVYVEGTVQVSGNYGANGSTSNIVLDNSSEDAYALIGVTNVLTDSEIGVKLLNSVVDSLVVTVDDDIEGMTSMEALEQFTYDDSEYKLDEDGTLISADDTSENVELEGSITSADWLSTNRVQVVGSANKSGTAYILVVKQESEEPSDEDIIAADQKVSITADQPFTFNHTFSAEEKEVVGTDAVSVYVCIVDEDGNVAIDAIDMDEDSRPPRVSGISYEWKSNDSVEIVCQSNKAGTFYYTWVKRDDSTPSISQCTEGEKVEADTPFSVTVTGMDPDSAIDVYIYVKGENGAVSAPIKAKPKESERPSADVTPTVTPAATATPTPSPTATPAPSAAPTLTAKSAATWLSHNHAQIVCVSDQDGSYYYGWSVRGSDGTSTKPDIDFSQPGTPIYANAEFTVDVDNISSDEAIDVYVYVKNADGTITGKKAKLSQDNRPSDKEASRDPIQPAVTESVVTGLEDPLEFYPNTFYPFTVTGAGTDNTDPVEGDTRWVPLYWSTSSNPSDSEKHSSWKIGTASGIQSANTYTLYVFYRQDRYNGYEWQATSTISSVPYSFYSADIEYSSLTPTPTAAAGYYYNEDGELVQQTDDTTDTGATTTATGARTADDSPVGTMSMLAMLSLLAGGYVITRKRRKTME